MAFTLPEFNLTANIHSVAGGVNTFRLDSLCNLAFGRRVLIMEGRGVNNGGMLAAGAQILFPAGTDVRDNSCGGDNDIIECPAGSGRWYIVMGVDDAGKGFPNEHRVVVCLKTWGFVGNGSGLTLPWPTPIP